MAALLQYPWPGNIRELFNVLERLVILADGSVLNMVNLPNNFKQTDFSLASLEKHSVDTKLSEITVNVEKEMITMVLVEEKFNKAAAAKKLGIPRSTLYYKMQKLGLKCQ